MYTMMVALALAGFAAGQVPVAAQAPAPGTAEVLTSVRQFVDDFNKGDTKATLAACVDTTSIIDELPPYEWHGAGACAKWMSDFDADAKKNVITDGVVTLGTPSHVDITADRAYVVIPTNYTFKQNGKPTKEVGSMFTFVMQRGQAGWRIIGWSWAKH